jgi:hypothetical protein
MAKPTKGQPKRTFTRATAVNFMRRGLLGDGAWRFRLGLFLFGVSVVRRVLQRDEHIVYSGQIEPGQTLTVRHLTETRG